MTFHPDVLAAHAQFGGDLAAMQALYDRPDHDSALTAAHQRIEELTRALEDVRPYLTDALDAHEHSDGRELLGRIDTILASKQGGER